MCYFFLFFPFNAAKSFCWNHRGGRMESINLPRLFKFLFVNLKTIWNFQPPTLIKWSGFCFASWKGNERSTASAPIFYNQLIKNYFCAFLHNSIALSMDLNSENLKRPRLMKGKICFKMARKINALRRTNWAREAGLRGREAPSGGWAAKRPGGVAP